MYAFCRIDSDGSNQRVELYDLSDGRRRTFFAPTGGTIWTDPPYVTADEMLVMGGMRIPPGPGGIRTIFRVQLASLPYE